MHKLENIVRTVFLSTLIVFVATGCSVAVRKNKADGLNEAFRSGDFANAMDIVQSTSNKQNALYFLEMGKLQRLNKSNGLVLSESTANLLEADKYVERWQVSYEDKLKKGLTNVSSYLISENFNHDYSLKNYEMGLLSQYLAINHLSEGRWGDAMVEANKMAGREKFIEAMIADKIFSAKKIAEEKAGGINFSKSNTEISSINGYPINLVTNSEILDLKNSYQNPATYFLSAFIYESQGEASLAAPGYRLAAELKPRILLFQNGLRNLDSNIVNLNRSRDADTLFIVETGFLPKMESMKFVKFFDVGNSKKSLTMSYPIIPRATEAFKLSSIQVNKKTIPLDLITNLDAMARRELKDELPNYIIRATSRAITSLGAQVLVDVAANSNRGGGGGSGSALAGIIGIIASEAVANSMQSLNVANVSHWQTLPAYSFLARTQTQAGPTNIQFALPNGALLNEEVILAQGHNVVYIRILRNTARLFVSKPAQHLIPTRPVEPIRSELLR